ncbi:hypothetical protein [Paraburkholderia sp. J94]|uniref:hypothetical protein n=1 Tax=Paraburkholderia sp. J94 TaxID=2805441 RepID=UPI002AB31604|nr:hypothetical protein [Paraburkholderia sp. J94]
MVYPNVTAIHFDPPVAGCGRSRAIARTPRSSQFRSSKAARRICPKKRAADSIKKDGYRMNPNVQDNKAP